MHYVLVFLIFLWGGVMLLMALYNLVRGRFSEVPWLGAMGLIGILAGLWAWHFIKRHTPAPPPAAVSQPAPPAGQPWAQPPARSPLAEDDSTALRDRMAGHLLRALAVWLGVVGLVTLGGMIGDRHYALTTGLARFFAVFWRCLLVLLAVQIALLVFQRAIPLGAPRPEAISKVLATIFGLVPLFFGVLGAISLFHFRDPWEYLPGGPPFALREFARKHPDLRVETVGLGGDTVFLESQGCRTYFYESELKEAALKWEASPDGFEPARLGGPPPFPGSNCLARLRWVWPDRDALSEEDLDRDVEPPQALTVRYVYKAGVERSQVIAEHFQNWAKGLGHDPPMYGYQGKTMEVTTGGNVWSIYIRHRRDFPDEIYIEYTAARKRAAAEGNP